jgi:tRNA dimethylallyltransferase
MQSLGYRHLVRYLSGEGSLEGAVKRIKLDTYRYAKRQMTWFTAEGGVTWLAPDACDRAASQIGPFLEGP